MGTPKAQHPPPSQLLFLILLSCAWIEGKDMWGWALGRFSWVFYLISLKILSLPSLWGRGGAQLTGKGQAKAHWLVRGALELLILRR